MEDKKAKPHIQYIFIDESGDLGKDGSKYFIISAIAVFDCLPIQRIIKKTRQRLLNKKLKEKAEIKANDSNDKTKKYVLKSIGSCDCSISTIAIPKSKLRTYLFDHKEKLYNYLCSMLFSHITLDTDLVNIVIDKKHSNRLLRDDLDNYLISKIKKRNSTIKIDIQHLESYNSNELQVVDFIAWAVNRKYTHDNLVFYNLIEDKIKNREKEELWK